jgi:hypothetical protein
MTDILRLLAPGVVVLPGVPVRLGVFGTWDEVGRAGSGVREGVRRSLVVRLLGTRKDFALIVLGLCFASSLLSFLRPMSLSDKADLLSALDFRPPTLGRLLTFSGLSCSGATNVPGPIDFLGALGPFVLLKALGGN